MINSNILLEEVVTARGIKSRDDRRKLFTALASPLADLPDDLLHPIWCETLHLLATRHRSDLLSDLTALAPVIHALGGDDAIDEIVLAIRDTGRWYP